MTRRIKCSARHLVLAVCVAAIAGAVAGHFLIAPLELPGIAKFALSAAIGYLSVYIAEKKLSCGP